MADRTNIFQGTTVYGAWDPINEVADICERHNLWLHVDVSLLNLAIKLNIKYIL